jgi:1-acyl-sn-glycerol-3-phosphate acyltransferase
MDGSYVNLIYVPQDASFVALIAIVSPSVYLFRMINRRRIFASFIIRLETSISQHFTQGANVIYLCNSQIIINVN